MTPMREPEVGRIKRLHPYAWLWEPMEGEASFVLKSMFGTNVVYLDGKIMLCFAAKEEPWRGLLVCTDHGYHASLMAEFPMLTPHSVLPKWLYLPETNDDFEKVAARLVGLSRRRDPRIGVAPKPRKRKRG